MRTISPIRSAAARRSPARIERLTLALILLCHGLWLGLIAWIGAGLPLWLGAPGLAVLVAFHSSLQHEALHGHPTASAAWNEALVFLPIGLLIPYRRFKKLHLKHHCDERLTDPYDDPESWYLAEADWNSLSAPLRVLLRVNNTLAGRLLIGPWLGVFGLIRADWPRILRGERSVGQAWLLHLVGAVPVIAWIWLVGGIAPWLYLLCAAWPGLSLLAIRTYAEHRAHPDPNKRSVIVEACPFFSLLFLNNNLHAAHHASPRTPWRDLPRLYRRERDAFAQRNGGYRYEGYGALFRQHFARGKEPVAHPFMRRDP